MKDKISPQLKNYCVLADTIQELNGELCEVIVHDLTRPESSVVYVANGSVTGRKIGQSFDHLVKQVLLDPDFKDDHLSNYFFQADNGKRIKSSSAIIRNDLGEIIGMLCINLDISHILESQRYLDNFLKGHQTKDHLADGEVGQDVLSIIDSLISSTIGGADIKNLNKTKNVEIIKFMDDKGIFLVKGAIDKVADLMGVSRVTIYSYIDEARGKK